ncbi:hypothetical protein [Vibrio sp. B1Z05]|uniref:hypothetical protein n=1 Tax=Vibrio sp. B1Z05 TaxID=2654980 RepID=UPI00128E88CA|nr:hypothetical protein [Vibrio sp. B1Z05]MPW37305.1 hypothetical protein [Vibrio sp. B1Z05]
MLQGWEAYSGLTSRDKKTSKTTNKPRKTVTRHTKIVFFFYFYELDKEERVQVKKAKGVYQLVQKQKKLIQKGFAVSKVVKFNPEIPIHLGFKIFGKETRYQLCNLGEE